MEATMGAERPAIVIGGLAFNRFAQLADFVGADLCGTDPAAAVTYGSQIVTA